MSGKSFKVDARAMLTWGRDSIKDHTTAILELVKNSYDAGASIVDVEILVSEIQSRELCIRISDDGCGMTEDDIDKKWLRIGYSEKLQNRTTGSGRRKTGEKGVGRISADRLGAVLELRTQAKGAEAVGLKVNWSAFEESDNDITQVIIPTIPDPAFSVPKPSPYDHSKKKYKEAPPRIPNSKTHPGTELTIRSLRHQWARTDLEDLRRELSILTSPFGTAKDFQIRVCNDIDENLNGVVTSPFYETAEIEASFSYVTGTNVHYVLKDRDKHGRAVVSGKGIVPWANFVHPDTGVRVGSDERKPAFGPLEVTLLFYPRVAETLRGTEFTVTDLKEFLDLNAGIKVYRDNIRVMPYGSPNRPEGDWLGLGDRKARNPAGPSRPDFRVGPNQIVGAVFLTRDGNPKIVDTSGREGLIHSDDFGELRAFLYGCLVALEAHYHKLFVEKKEEHDRTFVNPRETVREVNASLTELARDLRGVEVQLPKRASRDIEKVRDQIGQTFERIQKLSKASQELTDQATIYRGLATLGIASTAFAHETEVSLDTFLPSVYTACNLLRQSPSATDEALDELAKAIKYGERVSAWGAFALKRVRRDKRTKRSVDIKELVSQLIEELRPVFAASSIHVDGHYTGVKGRTFPMDIESVLLNLLTNAYYFCKLNGRKRIITVSLEPKLWDGSSGFEIVVADTGPGVRQDIRDQIWQPLFSTKVDKRGHPMGTGLGLSIVDSVVKDLGGQRQVDTDPQLKGARFTVRLRLG